MSPYVLNLIRKLEVIEYPRMYNAFRAAGYHQLPVTTLGLEFIHPNGNSIVCTMDGGIRFYGIYTRR